MDVNSSFDMAELKKTLPFGQVPYLVDGDVKLAQSNAIVRYLAKKGGIQGNNDKDHALSEMLIEEATDLAGLFAGAMRSPDKAAAYDALFTLGSPL